MKKETRLPLLIALVASITFGAFNGFASDSKEEPVPPGSIRLKHKIAKSKLPDYAKIDLATALHSAQEKIPGDAIEAELEVEDGTLVYSFLIVNHEKEIIEVEVDAGNGKVLATENEEDEDDD